MKRNRETGRKRRMQWAAKALALCLAGTAAFAGAGMISPANVQAAPDSIVGEQATGTLTVHKKAETAETPLSGATFSIYKVMSLTPGTEPGTYASYTPTDDFADVLDGITPDDLGNYSAAQIEGVIDGLVAVTKEDPKPTAAGTKTTGDNGDAVFSNLQLGYYLVIEDSAPEGYVTGSPFLIAVPSTDNYDDGNDGNVGTYWQYDVEASPKNKPVSIDKELAGAEEGAEQDGTVTVGDYVKYVVTTAIPDYPDNYFNQDVTFRINDVMDDGLAIQNTEEHKITVKVNGSEVTQSDSTYTLTAENVTEDAADLTISFAKEYIREHGGESVEVTYFAQVTEQAVTGTTGNKNSVTLEYNNNPGEETEAGPVEVTVYSFNIKVEKFTENGGKIPLDGAEFELYTDEALQNKIGGPVATDEAGNLSFQKLDAGTYYLKETKSPEGYTLLADAIKVEIIDPDGTGNFTLKVNDKEVDTTTGSFVTRLEQASGTAVVAVENHKGFSLPATGGAGIALFLIIGAAGIVTVSVVVARKTRREN